MTRRDILIFLFRWKVTLILVFATTVATVAALVYVLPPSYLAIARVLVEINRSPAQRSTFVSNPDVQEVMTTETAIILSRTVMTNVVDRLKPHERPAKDSVVRRTRESILAALADAGLIEISTPREKWIASLQNVVQAKAVTSSSVINIRYADEDPEWAARIANAVTDAYIAHHLSIFSQKNTSDPFRREMETSDATLVRLRQKLNEAKTKSSVAAIEENKRSLVQATTSLRDQRVKALTDQDELSARYESDHEKVKLARAKVAHLDAFLAETAAQLQNLEKAESGFRELELAILSEEQSLKDNKRRYDDARLNESADINHVNVRVIDYSPTPSQPYLSRIFMIAISIGGGIALAFGMAFLRQYFDRRVFSPQLAEQVLGVPELGFVPQSRRPLGDR